MQQRIVAVYPGRFQPMLPHHMEVFRGLRDKYGEAVIVTSSKTGADSPFSFDEKASIAQQMYGIGDDEIVQAASPYNIAEYARVLGTDAVVVIAVGEKDMQDDPRLPKGNQPVYKKNGELAALQPLEAHEGNLQPVTQHAYVTVAPTVMTGDRPASASAFRAEFQSAHDDETAKEVFRRYFGKYNEDVFQLVNSKLRENEIMKQLNEMRRLAGQRESNMKKVTEASTVNIDHKNKQVSMNVTRWRNTFPEYKKIEDGKKYINLQGLNASRFAHIDDWYEVIIAGSHPWHPRREKKDSKPWPDTFAEGKRDHISEINQVRQLAGLPPIKTPVTEALVDYDGDIDGEADLPVAAKSVQRVTDPAQLLDLAKRATINPPLVPKDYDTLASFIEDYRGLGSGNGTQQSQALARLASRSTHLALVLGVLQSRLPGEFDDLSLYLEDLAARIADGEQLDQDEGDVVKSILARSVNQGFWKKLFDGAESVFEMRVGLDAWRVHGENGEVEFVPDASSEEEAVRKIQLELPHVTWLHAEKLDGEMTAEDQDDRMMPAVDRARRPDGSVDLDAYRKSLPKTPSADQESSREQRAYRRGSRDRYYGHRQKPSFEDADGTWVTQEDMTPEEIAAYRRGYDEEQDRKDWG